MTITSNQIYSKKNLSERDNFLQKSYIVDQLLLMIQNIDDTSVRCDCLKGLENIDFKSNKLYFDLENLLVSDSEDKVRKQAAIIIGKSFHRQGLDPLIFSILHEKNYDNILTILLILENLNAREIHDILVGNYPK